MAVSTLAPMVMSAITISTVLSLEPFRGGR